jgi:hypothetical protein
MILDYIRVKNKWLKPAHENGRLYYKKQLISFYDDFFLNAFCVCGWPFYVFYVFYRLA